MMSNASDQLPLNEDREISARNNSLSLESLRVLLVDDNEDSLVLTTYILEGYGIETITAASADEALKIFLEAKPDILISDLAMPGEDGYSLIRKIRNLEPEQGKDIPAIALTASARDKDRSLSIEAGYQIHLTKPTDFTELFEAIAALARQFHK